MSHDAEHKRNHAPTVQSCVPHLGSALVTPPESQECAGDCETILTSVCQSLTGKILSADTVRSHSMVSAPSETAATMTMFVCIGTVGVKRRRNSVESTMSPEVS